mmetsp:Transcript_23694/g.82424  ORF Transcript_23694/g.82424 Transcript_23694/m.82424 type:complete len:206 (-) Transcript_23694:435-1052(-)
MEHLSAVALFRNVHVGHAFSAPPPSVVPSTSAGSGGMEAGGCAPSPPARGPEGSSSSAGSGTADDAPASPSPPLPPPPAPPVLPPPPPPPPPAPPSVPSSPLLSPSPAPPSAGRSFASSDSPDSPAGGADSPIPPLLMYRCAPGGHSPMSLSSGTPSIGSHHHQNCAQSILPGLLRGARHKIFSSPAGTMSTIPFLVAPASGGRS